MLWFWREYSQIWYACVSVVELGGMFFCCPLFFEYILKALSTFRTTPQNTAGRTARVCWGAAADSFWPLNLLIVCLFQSSSLKKYQLWMACWDIPSMRPPLAPSLPWAILHLPWHSAQKWQETLVSRLPCRWSPCVFSFSLGKPPPHGNQTLTTSLILSLRPPRWRHLSLPPHLHKISRWWNIYPNAYP